MANILHEVGTPLQLVALFLLLVAGIARLLLRSGKWKPSPAINKLVVNRLFQVGLAALIIGVVGPAVAPVLDRWLNGDETLHGVVLSKTGEAIPGASVNLIPITTVQTNALGQFDIPVPRNRVLKDYKLEVKARGYEAMPATSKSDSEMRDVEVRLAPAPLELVKRLEPNFVIGQYYGAPIVLVTLRVENAGDSLTSIPDVHGVLTNKGASMLIAPAYWTILSPFGPFYPVTGAFPVPARQNLDLRIVLTPGVNFAGLSNQMSALSEYRSQAPCTQKYNGSMDPLTDAGFDIVKAFAEGHFGWKEGDWHLQLDVTSENEAKTFQRDFTLSAADVEQLRASISLLKQCLGVNLTAPLAQDGSLANFLSK